MKTTLFGALFLSLALAACEKSESPDSAKKAVDETSNKTPDVGDKKGTGDDKQPDTEAPTSPGAKGDGVQVSLVEPGAEPRQKLRLAIKEGQTFKAEMRMQMDMTMSVAGARQPKVKLPVMVAVMDIKTTSASADAFEFDWSISDYDVAPTPGVMPQVMGALKTQLKTLVGTKGTGKVDSRGRNLGSTFEIPPNVPPQTAQIMEGMRDAISTMSAPVPDEAIGVGGSWKVSQLMVQNGTKSNVEYIYKVKAINGDKVELDVEVKTTGVPGPVVNPMIPPGANATLDSMSGSGGGEVVLSLDSIVPAKSKVETKNTSAMTIKAMGQTQKTVTDIDLSIEMKAL